MNKEGVTGRWAKKRKRTWLSVNLLVYTSGIISFPGERETRLLYILGDGGLVCRCRLEPETDRETSTRFLVFYGFHQLERPA
jgi:hypothetical protein